jgi:hypothetical protein
MVGGFMLVFDEHNRISMKNSDIHRKPSSIDIFKHHQYLPRIHYFLYNQKLLIRNFFCGSMLYICFNLMYNKK